MTVAVIVSVVVFLILEGAIPAAVSGFAIGAAWNDPFIKTETQLMVFGCFIVAALTAISWKLSELIATQGEPDR